MTFYVLAYTHVLDALSKDDIYDSGEPEDEKTSPSGCFPESSPNLIVTLSSKIEEQQIEIDRLTKQIQNYSTGITNHGDVQ